MFTFGSGNEKYTEAVNQIKYSYVLAFGDFNSLYADYNPLQFFMFVVFTFFIPLLLMNMLIAIMSDSYARVQANIISANARSIASMVLEMEEIVHFFKPSEQKENSYYFLFFTAQQGEGDGGDSGEWEGVVGSLKAILKDQIHHLYEKLEELEQTKTTGKEKNSQDITRILETVNELKLKLQDKATPALEDVPAQE